MIRPLPAPDRDTTEGQAQPRHDSDFARVLELIASDPAFERALLLDPDRALRSFHLDSDEYAVLRTYRRWRIPF